ncbi:hypothetical protein CLIM01_14389 [Colletotrichum limetticola]|uniref:Winged helix-turn helix domain-containing protein n=1 Tax=Colletotrichum limetticola TaxID=1209924 RepID=A0ABQ9P9P0_9PEZI|nr:hypothetical protein CLIM01_14389 [Colletotrichum limetticola]
MSCPCSATHPSKAKLLRSDESPPNGAGRPRNIAPPMLSALFERLIEKPDMYLEEMAMFLFDEFDTLVTASTIGRTLRRAGWTKKTARRIARERNADLRDYYLHKLTKSPPARKIHTSQHAIQKPQTRFVAH